LPTRRDNTFYTQLSPDKGRYAAAASTTSGFGQHASSAAVQLPIGPTHTIARHQLELQWSLQNPTEDVDILLMLLYADSQLDTLMNSVYAQHQALPGDLIGLRLEFENDPTAIYKMVRLHNNPLGTLLSALGRILNSNADVLFKHWTLTIDIIRNPNGGGGKRKRKPRSPKHKSKKSKRSARSKKKAGTFDASRFLVQVQEEDEDGRLVTMSDDSEAGSEGDLSDFIVSDGHMSDDDEQARHVYFHRSTLHNIPPSESCSSGDISAYAPPRYAHMGTAPDGCERESESDLSDFIVSDGHLSEDELSSPPDVTNLPPSSSPTSSHSRANKRRFKRLKRRFQRAPLCTPPAWQPESTLTPPQERLSFTLAASPPSSTPFPPPPPTPLSPVSPANRIDSRDAGSSHRAPPTQTTSQKRRKLKRLKKRQQTTPHVSALPTNATPPSASNTLSSMHPTDSTKTARAPTSASSSTSPQTAPQKRRRLKRLKHRHRDGVPFTVPASPFSSIQSSASVASSSAGIAAAPSPSSSSESSHSTSPQTVSQKPRKLKRLKKRQRDGSSITSSSVSSAAQSPIVPPPLFEVPRPRAARPTMQKLQDSPSLCSPSNLRAPKRPKVHAVPPVAQVAPALVPINPVSPNLPVHRNINPASLDAMKKKRCIVRIVNPEDELCLYRAVVVSLAHKNYEEAVNSGKSKRECAELKKEYNNIKKARTSKCRTRKQELAAKQLQSEVQGKAPADFDDVVKVAHHLKRNIVVLNMDYQNTKPRFVQFQTRNVHDYGVDTTLFVYLEVRSLISDNAYCM